MKASHRRRSLLLFVYSDSYYGRARAEVRTNQMGYITVIARVAMDLWQRKPTLSSGYALGLGLFTAINPWLPCYNYYILPSTLQAISESRKVGNKQTLSVVSSSVGGVLSAIDPCSLPRNEQQVADVKRRLKKSNSGGLDELAVVMQKAYLEDDGNQFIREMKILREPAIVVATERQISDLVRFCTNSSNFGIMTIDPTFSLGEFDVTVTTYRQLTLQSRCTDDHPVFIGPVMIHYRKSFSTYLFFASTLLGMKPEP